LENVNTSLEFGTTLVIDADKFIIKIMHLTVGVNIEVVEKDTQLQKRINLNVQ